MTWKSSTFSIPSHPVGGRVSTAAEQGLAQIGAEGDSSCYDDVGYGRYTTFTASSGRSSSDSCCTGKSTCKENLRELRTKHGEMTELSIRHGRQQEAFQLTEGKMRHAEVQLVDESQQSDFPMSLAR